MNLSRHECCIPSGHLVPTLHLERPLDFNFMAVDIPSRCFFHFVHEEIKLVIINLKTVISRGEHASHYFVPVGCKMLNTLFMEPGVHFRVFRDMKIL